MKESSSDKKPKHTRKGPIHSFEAGGPATPPEQKLNKYDDFDFDQAKYKVVRKVWEDLVKGYTFLDRDYESRGGLNAKTDLKMVGYNPFSAEGDSAWKAIQQDTAAMNSNQAKPNMKLVPYDTYKKSDDEHKKFIQAVELAPSIVIVMNRNCRIEYVNPNFREVTGYKNKEIIGKDFGVMISDLASHDEYDQIVQAIAAGISWKGELVNRKKNGEWFILKAEIAPVKDDEGGIIDYLIVGQDVTPFRETEIRLEEALDDKSILLSELHHRVKNNLAILSGMMQLQAFDESSEVLQSKLFSSVGRVKTMASMHELLYESGSFSRLEFGRNIERIVSSVSGMYSDFGMPVEVNYDMEPVLLNINQAHPCSLIMNEVITNVFKHAFVGKKEGTLTISMKTRANKVSITIADNGNGLPEGFKIKEGRFTLGHQLLRTLVRQLNGKFEYASSAKGSSFTLEFIRDNSKGTANASMV